MRTGSLFAGAILVALGLVFVSYYHVVYQPGRDAGRLVRQAQLVHERGDRESLKLALDLATTLVATYPESKYVPDATFLIADVYERSGLKRLAYEKYEALAVHPRLSKRPDLATEVNARLAVLKIKRNYSEEGIARLLSIISNSSDAQFRSRVYCEIAYERLKMGKFAEAGSAFTLALNEDPENADALQGKERALACQSTLAAPKAPAANTGAQRSQQTSNTLGRRLSGDRIYQAGLYDVRNGRHRSARAHFNDFIRRYPSSKYVENASYWMGESFYSTGNFETAIDWFNKTLSNRWRHKDEDSMVKIGCSYYMLKKYDLAAREFSNYLERYPVGRYRDFALRWKESSSRALTERIRPDAASNNAGEGLNEQMRAPRTSRAAYAETAEPVSVIEL